MVAAVASYFSKINIFLWGREREDAIFSFPFKTYFLSKDFLKITKKGEILAMKNRKYLSLKGTVKVHFYSLARKCRLASFYFHKNSNFRKSRTLRAKCRKTAKNEENPRKSRVFRLASFLSTRANARDTFRCPFCVGGVGLVA